MVRNRNCPRWKGNQGEVMKSKINVDGVLIQTQGLLDLGWTPPPLPKVGDVLAAQDNARLTVRTVDFYGEVHMINYEFRDEDGEWFIAGHDLVCEVAGNDGTDLTWACSNIMDIIRLYEGEE